MGDRELGHDFLLETYDEWDTYFKIIAVHLQVLRAHSGGEKAELYRQLCSLKPQPSIIDHLLLVDMLLLSNNVFVRWWGIISCLATTNSKRTTLS